MISSQEIKNTFQFSNVQKDVKIYPKWQNCLFLLTQDIIKGTVFIGKDMNSYLPKNLHHQVVLRALCVCFAIFYGCNVLRKRAVFIARKYLFLSFPTYKISYTINTQVSIYIVLRAAYYIYIIKLGTVFTRLKKKPRMIFFFSFPFLIDDDFNINWPCSCSSSLRMHICEQLRGNAIYAFTLIVLTS